MRAPLREKIQNAINRAINDNHHVPYNDYNNNNGLDGALIVGGRRRNRKKKNKKNGQKKKKSPSLESIKTKLSPSGSRKGGKGQENIPLIEKGDDQGTAQESQDTEDGDMVFWKKKKPAPAEPAVTPKTADTSTDGAPKEGTEAEATKASPEQQAADAKANGDVTEQSKVSVDASKDGSNSAVTFTKDAKQEGDGTADGKGAPPEGTGAEKKSEKSPLITKDGKDGGAEAEGSKGGNESKLKDSGPGFLCCSIL